MKLKLSVPQWHYSMLMDYERLAIFKEAIERTVNKNDVIYDLGTGSGILAMIAGRLCKKVYGIELDPITYEFAKENIKVNGFKNIEIIEGDAKEYKFKECADVIISEMLDTALITEPQVPVINSIHKRGLLKEGGKIIPEKTYSTAQLVVAKMNHIYYDEEITSKSISMEVLYETVDFYKINDERVSYEIKLKPNISKKMTLNIGLRLNTYTQLCDGYMAGSTPMLNPPLIIPIEMDYTVYPNEDIIIKLSYKRGGDFESIDCKIGD